MDPLLHDVQRELPFYRACVAFRNAVEVMVIRRRDGLGPHDTVVPDESMFWGLPRASLLRFDRLGDDDGEAGNSSETRSWDDDRGGGMAGSRVPRRPPGDPGVAGAEAVPDDEPSESIHLGGVLTLPGPEPSERPYDGL